jgi:hypothetical protein
MSSLDRAIKHLPNITLDPLSRVYRDENGHIWTTDDTLVVILKGHLLVEAELIDICRRLLVNPNAMAGDKIGFYSRLNLVRALVGDDDPVPGSFWKALTILNNLRNTLAHNLEHDRVETLIGDFLKVFEDFPDFSAINNLRDNINTRLVGCMVFLCGGLSGVGKPKAASETEGAA